MESPNSGEFFVFFATITHPDLVSAITVNSDVVDYVYNGSTYYGCAFALVRLTDDEQPPRAKVTIENVDQIIGRVVSALLSPPTIGIQLFVKSDFTDDVPRKAIGTPTAVESAQGLKLQNVQWDASTITADLVGVDITSRPWPSIRSTSDRLPGLYR